MIQAEKHGLDPDSAKRSSAAETAPAQPAPSGVGSGFGLMDAADLMAVQRAAGNQAATHLIGRVGTGGQAVGSLPVQRTVIPAEQTWLRQVLTSTGAALGTHLATAPYARLLRMDPGDMADTVRSLWPLVDPFENAVAASPSFGDAEACRLISVIEDTQPSSMVAIRLSMMFSSGNPFRGLAAIQMMDHDRVRAALQPARMLTKPSLDVLMRRLTGIPVPSHLQTALRLLRTIHAELGAPTTEGVTPSDATRETNVTNILTPPSVVAANAAAAAAGRPPPAFVSAGYYDDMINALHAVATRQWHRADQQNRRAPMDTSSGGRVEQIAGEAKRRVDNLFGVFGSFAAPAMTMGVNLFDQSARGGNAWDMARWFVNDSGEPEITAVNDAHHAFGVAAANSIRSLVIDQYSGRRAAPPPVETRLAVSRSERQARLELTDRMWPGMQQAGRVYLTPREGDNPFETRMLYWNLFKTCVHEYLHTTAHPTYQTWYGGLQDPHHKITYQEGFTDWFTLKTWRSVFPTEVASDPAFRRIIQGSTDVDLAAAFGDPPHYPEMAEAELLESEIGLANMRAAYFRGNTAVLGGRRLPR